MAHFEVPYDDKTRMVGFYAKAFGWQNKMPGEDMSNYVVTTTTPSVDSGPKKPGVINGGFYKRNPDWPAQHPSVVIAVDDIQAFIRQVKQAC